MVAKKDEKLELMYNVSKASFISLFIFLFIAFLATSTFTSTTIKSYINAQFSPLKLSILVFGIFLITLAIPYNKIKILRFLIRLKKLYSEKIPHIIMGIGYSLTLVSFLAILNFPPQLPIASTLYGLILMVILGFGLFIFVPFGIILFIVSFSAKMYLGGRNSFTLKKETIVNVIIMIASIITAILAYLQYQKQ